MATYKYKFMLLNDKNASTNQSRGLSLQFNGYVPFNGPVNTSTLPDVEEMVSNGSILLMLRDLSYIADASKNVRSADARYEQYKNDPASHMFTDISAVPSDEFATVDTEGNSRGSTTLDIPLYDTMFGDKLAGEARVDGIILYGQAYNVDFYNDTAQGQLEKSIPLAIVVFTDNQPTILPSSESKTMSKFRLALSFRVIGDAQEGSVLSIEDTADFQLWKEFAGNFHVVNNDMLTSGSFVLRGRGVEPIATSDLNDKDSVWGEGKTVDFNSRVFFTNDVPNGSNFDHNVDFGSPARLTVFNREIPVEDDTRYPQTMIGKVAYSTDDNGYLHGYWDGVAETYYGAISSDGGTIEPVSGSVYDIDWISNDKPAISIFSTGNEYAFVNSAYGLESACFANGTNLFSEDCQSCSEGLNLKSKNVSTRGDAVVFDSVNVSAYGSSSAEVEQRVLIENSKNILIDNIDFAKNSAVTVLNADGDKVKRSSGIVLGNTRSSQITDCRDITSIGGRLTANYAEGNVVIGVGEGSQGNSNTLLGQENSLTGDIYKPKSSLILGRNNMIDARYENERGIVSYHNVANVMELGRKLINDPRQNPEDLKNSDFTTIVLGQKNSYYHEDYKAKSLVLGGYSSTDWEAKYRFKYNSFEVAEHFPDAYNYPEEGAGRHWNKETIASLIDIKGRKVDYGSSSIDLKYMKPEDIDETTYRNYDFNDYGRINWFKLYDLLAHLVWIPDGGADNGGYVRLFREGTSGSNMRWFSRESHWIGGVQQWSVLSDLVDDTKSHWPYQVNSIR